jgi:DNA topoisomerase-3
MSFRLVLAEKPSVARDIARVLKISGGGRGWIGSGHTRVSWCLGHLVELAEPKAYDPRWRAWRSELLPMLPEVFELAPRKDTEDHYKIVRGLLRDRSLTEVVNACDAGREGELIFSNVYRHAGCKAPVLRLWISSMTTDAIAAGFRALRPGRDLADLDAAARCRSEADWLVGLNATRAMTLALRSGGDSTLLSVGRVQTPTLALLARREDAIDEFVPESFFQVHVQLRAEKGEWKATWTLPGKTGPDGGPPDRVPTAAAADEILARIAGRDAIVSRVERKKSRERHPLLYDLTTLQKEANKRFSFSAKKTLDTAQALYEKHKVVTYPRTDSRHLTSDQRKGLQRLVEALDFGPYAGAAQATLQRWPVRLGKRVIDDSEVSDHHAIIPTGVDPRRANLSVDEKRVFDLIARRFLAVFQDDAVFAVAKITTSVGDDLFVAKGRTRLAAGWQAIDPPASKKGKQEVLLPAVEVGDPATVVEAERKAGKTRPPRRHNEASLLGAMERAGEGLEDAELKRAMKRSGLGTPATRAAIIETLLRRGFVIREKRELVPTPQGRALIRAMPVAELTSAELTGRWEARLAAMAEGEDDRDAFMADTRAFAERVVGLLLALTVDDAVRADLTPRQTADGAVLGSCPRCGGEVREGPRAWRCGGCSVVISKSIARRDVSKRMAKALLAGPTSAVKGWKNREGKPFTAGLVIDEQGAVRFHFPKPEPLGPCPACGEPVRPRGAIYSCDTGRECPFVVFADMSGRAASPEEVAELVKEGRTRVLSGFVTRDGAAFSGRLRWNGQRVVVDRADTREESVGTCPRCRSEVQFLGEEWACTGCPVRVPATVAQRDLRPQEVRALLADGRTPRLHGFRRAAGSVFKAALFLDDDGRVQIDYTKPADEPEETVPKGGPPFAFGKRHNCPLCIDRAEPEPGYVIAGRAAWGCSRWKTCTLRLPFETLTVRLTDKMVIRLIGRHRETTLMKMPIGIGGAVIQGRLRIAPDADGGWRAVRKGK